MGRFLMVLSGLGAVILVVIVVLAIWALTGHFEPSHAGPAS
jgi:hypothetical protein